MSRDPVEKLDVAELVAEGGELEFECELKDLTRLAPLLREQRGSAHARFRFSDLAGFAVAKGRVKATLALTCQRCLDEVAVPLEVESQLFFVEGELVDPDGPADYEPVAMHGGRISQAELLEDELILALPLIATHGEDSGCVARPAAESQAARESTQRPFAGLRELMKD
jgi:uncharacterized protein